VHSSLSDLIAMSKDQTGVKLDRAARMPTNPVGLDSANYPRNSWWVAGLSTEIGSQPLARWILDLPVVLYRGEDGQAVALDDRCPHRWAPLSMGRVVGSDIACAYHGFRFAPDGRCSHIPTQDKVPSVARVRSYPVVEVPPFVWIWTGTPSSAPDSEPPWRELEWAVAPDRVTASGSMQVECNYLALKENVLDLSHFGFLHADTLGPTDWTAPPQFEKTDQAVSYRQEFRGIPLPALYGIPTGIGCDQPVDRRAWGSYITPALQTAGVDIEVPDNAGPQRKRFSLRVAHLTTPVNPSRFHYWWFFSQDYGHGAGAVERLTARIEAAFLQDKAVLEATEAMVRRDARARDYLDISVACDRAGVEARRRVQSLVEQES
jgi:phenylpropionate dioxygenase-like ring-hydroxylating dioxygenase large terminal subunit